MLLREILISCFQPNTIFCGVGTPLNGALTYRSLKCMKLLIKVGADVNGKDLDPQHLCTVATVP